MKVKVKKCHGMKHKGICQEVPLGIKGEEVNLVRYHMGEDNMGTNLKVENHVKPMPIKSMVKKWEKSMVTNIKGKSKKVITTTTKWVREEEIIMGTKAEIEAEMWESTLSRLVSHLSKGNVIPMFV